LGIVCGAGLMLPVDPWAPNIDSRSLASQLFAFSLFPYISFLYLLPNPSLLLSSPSLVSTSCLHLLGLQVSFFLHIFVYVCANFDSVFFFCVLEVSEISGW